MQLKRILITHADPDHVGAAAALQKWSGAQVCASQEAARVMPEGRLSRYVVISGWNRRLLKGVEPVFSYPPVRADMILSHGQVLPILGGLEVHATPGHTPCHLVYFAPRHSILFSGDAVRIRRGRMRYNLIKPFTWDADQVIASTQYLAALEPRIICGGHGDVLFDPRGKFPHASR